MDKMTADSWVFIQKPKTAAGIFEGFSTVSHQPNLFFSPAQSLLGKSEECQKATISQEARKQQP